MFTGKAVGAVRTHPLPAVWSTEARLAQTASVDVVAARSVGAVTHAFTVLPIAADRTLLTAPGVEQMPRENVPDIYI